MNEIKFKIEQFQKLLIEISTNGYREGEEYENLRTELLNNDLIKNHLPDFVKKNRNTMQFWQFIKIKFKSYGERREFIWNAFSYSLDFLEKDQNGIINSNTTLKIDKFGQEYITIEWVKAMERKNNDPEGALTSARTLIETTCKFILESKKIEFKDELELPKLYKLTAENLNLAPDQHTEKIFKQILGGCQTVVEGLGALRNKLSDSHGKRKTQTKPTSRHAELGVNLAGAMTTFLIETYEFNILKEKKPATNSGLAQLGF